MKTLFDAISARWTAIVGATPLYNTEADDEAPYPYGVVNIIDDTPDWTFTEDSENIMFQFNIFSDADADTTLLAIFELVKTAFDKFDLVIAGVTTISLKRGPAYLQRVDGIWQVNVTYMIEYEI